MLILTPKTNSIHLGD